MKHSFIYRKTLSLILAFAVAFTTIPINVFAEYLPIVSDIYSEEGSSYEYGIAPYEYTYEDEETSLGVEDTGELYSLEPEEGLKEVELTVTLTSIADFHGMMNSENSAADPGFARFVTFMNSYQDRIKDETGHRPVLLHAGDSFFGQSINNLMWGEPSLRILNHLGVRYGSIGNHEFSWQNRLLTESFGEADPVRRAKLLESVNRSANPIWETLPADHSLNVVEGGIPFLGADVVYEDGHPRAGEYPDWLQPYAILDDWYEEYGVRIALVGLTHPNMASLVGPMDRIGLNFRTPRLVQGEDTNFGWLEDMITMLRDPEGSYGVNAVVALTHTSSGNYSNMIVDRLQRRGNAHFDGFFSGHSHDTVNTIRTYGDLSTAIVLGGHHAHGVGDIQLGFDAEGELVNLQGNLTANVRTYEPDPVVFEWVHGVGATWDALGTGSNINLEISNQPPLDGDRGDWGWEQVRDYWWGRPVGPRVTYATGSQHHRNQFLVNLLYDYVMREHADDLAYTTGEPFAGTVIINNQSAWRGQDADELTWGPEDQVNTVQLMAALTFENTMPLFEIRGRDLIEMLNMPGANRGAGETNTPATPGRITNPESPFYGQPNWFTMHGSTVTGAFYQDGAWYMASTLEPISLDGVYRLGASNHLFGGYAQNGGQHWPLPGNNHGNALGFDVIDFIDENEQFGAAYDRGPRRAIRDTSNEMHLTIQETWLRETSHRADLTEEGISLAAWIEVEATVGGNAELAIWGLGTREFPGASNHSGWGLPAYGPANNTTRDLVLNGSVVRITATIDENSDDIFLGWFADGVLVSRDEVFIFNAEDDITLEARFGEEPDELCRELLDAQAALQQLIEYVATLDAADFTIATWSELQVALIAAENALENGDLAAVLAATTALQDALDALVEIDRTPEPEERPTGPTGPAGSGSGNKNNGNRLPQTGATMVGSVLLGVIALASGLSMAEKKRREK